MTKTRSQPVLPRRPLYTSQEIEAHWKRLVPAVAAVAALGPRPVRQTGRVTTERVDACVGVTFRMPKTTVTVLDAYAAAANISRSEAIRRILEERLA